MPPLPHALENYVKPTYLRLDILRKQSNFYQVKFCLFYLFDRKEETNPMSFRILGFLLKLAPKLWPFCPLDPLVVIKATPKRFLCSCQSIVKARGHPVRYQQLFPLGSVQERKKQAVSLW